MKVVELGINFYQFIFYLQEKKDRVLLERLWFFENQIIVIHLWKQNFRSDDELLGKVQMQVQVRGYQIIGWLEKLAEIGKLFLRFIIPENSSKNGLLFKLLVEVELQKPLLRGTKLKFHNESVWTELRYEKLPTFCFYCEIMGHQEKSCVRKMHNSMNSSINEGQYGEWMRVPGSVEGRRIGSQSQAWGRNLRYLRES